MDLAEYRIYFDHDARVYLKRIARRAMTDPIHFVRAIARLARHRIPGDMLFAQYFDFTKMRRRATWQKAWWDMLSLDEREFIEHEWGGRHHINLEIATGQFALATLHRLNGNAFRPNFMKSLRRHTADKSRESILHDWARRSLARKTVQTLASSQPRRRL